MITPSPEQFSAVNNLEYATAQFNAALQRATELGLTVKVEPVDVTSMTWRGKRPNIFYSVWCTIEETYTFQANRTC